MKSTLPDAIVALRADSEAGRTLTESKALAAPLSEADAAAAQAAIEADPEAAWYHTLFALRRGHPAIYAALPANVRAAVLCGALGHLSFYNDWGYLDPSGSFDGEAARAMLELGPDAAACLVPLLADTAPAPLYGSETATLSSMYGYRRADFAYRYLLALRGEQPAFARDQAERDRAIAAERAR